MSIDNLEQEMEASLAVDAVLFDMPFLCEKQIFETLKALNYPCKNSKSLFT